MEVHYTALLSHLSGQVVPALTDFNGIRTRLIKAHGRQGIKFGEPLTDKYILLVGPTLRRLISLKNVILSNVSLLKSINPTIENIVDDYVDVIYDTIPLEKIELRPNAKYLGNTVEWGNCEMAGVDRIHRNRYGVVFGKCGDIVPTVICELTLFYKEHLLKKLAERIVFDE